MMYKSSYKNARPTTLQKLTTTKPNKHIRTQIEEPHTIVHTKPYTRAKDEEEIIKERLKALL